MKKRGLILLERIVVAMVVTISSGADIIKSINQATVVVVGSVDQEIVVDIGNISLVRSIVQQGSTYVDRGAWAYDNFDGDLTDQIFTLNFVETRNLGLGFVIYRVSDQCGNAAESIKTVMVTEQMLPAIVCHLVPKSGTDEIDLSGTAYGVNPSKFGVAIYLEVFANWYIKPELQTIVPLNEDGSWQETVMIQTNDSMATRIVAYLVPLWTALPDCWPVQCLARPDAELPESVAYACVSRSQNHDGLMLAQTTFPTSENGLVEVSGIVSAVEPSQYGVATAIRRTDGEWEPRPLDGSLAPINEFGCWSNPVVIDAGHYDYLEIASWLVPLDAEMPELFSGQFRPVVTQALAFASFCPKRLWFESVPSLGTDLPLEGKVDISDPSSYGVMVYVRGGDTVIYPKPNVATLATIDSQGNWRQTIVTHPNDKQAPEVGAFLVRIGTDLPSCWPDLCLKWPKIPEAVNSEWVDRREIQ